MTVDRLTGPGAGAPPSAIVVAYHPSGDGGGDADGVTAREVGEAVAAEVVAELRRRRLPASAPVAGGQPADALRLELRLLRLERGSRWKRVVVGFGLGQSKLEVSAVLHRGLSGPGPLVAFQVDAGSGREPGAATALIGMAGGGVALPALQGGLTAARLGGLGTEQDMADTATAVADRLDIFFRSVGWLGWTTAPGSYLRADRALPPPVPIRP